MVPSDRSVKPIFGNPDIEPIEEAAYTSPIEDLDLINSNELASLDRDQLAEYLLKVYKIAVANITSQDKLNLLKYFVTIM